MQCLLILLKPTGITVLVAVTSTALILSMQIESFLNAVENVQKAVLDHIVDIGSRDGEAQESGLSRYDLHLKLRDQAAGMPFVGSLTIVNDKGKVINFSRQWPVPDIDVSDRDFFKAFQSDPKLTSFLSEPVRNRATGTWVMHLARKSLIFLQTDGPALRLPVRSLTHNDSGPVRRHVEHCRVGIQIDRCRTRLPGNRLSTRPAALPFPDTDKRHLRVASGEVSGIPPRTRWGKRPRYTCIWRATSPRSVGWRYIEIPFRAAHPHSWTSSSSR